MLTSNTEIPGYEFYFNSYISVAGGVGLYVKSTATASKRGDLTPRNKDFKTIRVEIANSKAKNIQCCCAYRNPNSDVAKFSDHLQEMLPNVQNENKIICKMGDFNINKIDYASHAATNDFINMFSNQLQPSVVHPTRITDKTSTLNDNIYCIML